MFFSFPFYYASYLLEEREGAEERALTRVGKLVEKVERTLNEVFPAFFLVAEAKQKNESLVLHS